MDDSSHEPKASVSQSFYAHGSNHVKPPSHEEEQSRNVPLRPSSEPQQALNEGAEIAPRPPLSYKEWSDELLVEQAERGNREAFGILVERYEKAIRRYILRLIEDDNITDEITQDTFLKAWQSLPMHDRKRIMNFRPWLYRVAYTTTIDHLRKKPLETHSVPIESKSVKEPGHSSWAEKIEQDLCKRESIVAALNQMYPQYRQCLLMRYVGEYGFQEIAHELNISEVTVRTYISRGRKQFIQAYLGEIRNGTDKNDTPREEGK